MGRGAGFLRAKFVMFSLRLPSATQVVHGIRLAVPDRVRLAPRGPHGRDSGLTGRSGPCGLGVGVSGSGASRARGEFAQGRGDSGAWGRKDGAGSAGHRGSALHK